MTFELFKKLVFSFALASPIILSIEKNTYYMIKTVAYFRLSFVTKHKIYSYSYNFFNKEGIEFLSKEEQDKASEVLYKMYINLKFNNLLDKCVIDLEKLIMIN